MAWVGVAVVGILAALVGRMLVVHHTFDTFEPTKLDCSRVQRVGKPLLVPVGGGAEDMVIDHELGVTFLSVCNFRANFFRMGAYDDAGGIFLYNLTQPHSDVVPCRLVGFPSEYDFGCTHGVGLLRPTSPYQDRYLFVIAHALRSSPMRNSIHKFAISPNSPDELRYVETFESDQHLISPNDVVPVGERTFFVTNDHSTRSDFLNLLHDLQLLPNVWPANVVHFDGLQWRVAVDGLRSANGINASPDHSMLYVNDAGMGTLLTYNLSAMHEQGDQRLELVDSIAMHTMVDNIDVDMDGTLWVGAHPKFFLLPGHLIDPAANRAMSQVLRVHANKSGRVEQVYLNEGDEIAASSVGAYWHARNAPETNKEGKEQKGHLLIGAVVDNWILHCRV